MSQMPWQKQKMEPHPALVQAAGEFLKLLTRQEYNLLMNSIALLERLERQNAMNYYVQNRARQSIYGPGPPAATATTNQMYRTTSLKTLNLQRSQQNLRKMGPQGQTGKIMKQKQRLTQEYRRQDPNRN